MKTKLLALFLTISCFSHAQSTWDYKITSDSIKIYLSDTVHGVYTTLSRCGLNVYKNSKGVYLYINPNTPVNQWDTLVNLTFLAPSVDSGYRLLKNLAFSNCVGTNILIPFVDTGHIVTIRQLDDSLVWHKNGYGYVETDITQNVGIGTLTPQATLDVNAPSGLGNVFFRVGTDGVVHYNYNDDYMILNGSTRRFQIGDLTGDWYNTYVDINDDVATQGISLHASNGVTINNLAGNGIGIAGVDNSGVLSWQAFPVQAIDTFTSTTNQTSFTISNTPLGRVAMSNNGVVQDYGTDYTESGTTITTSAIPAGHKIQFIYIHK